MTVKKLSPEQVERMKKKRKNRKNQKEMDELFPGWGEMKSLSRGVYEEDKGPTKVQEKDWERLRKVKPEEETRNLKEFEQH